jgi:integrating conjugative element protein (TIGR03761 family)
MIEDKADDKNKPQPKKEDQKKVENAKNLGFNSEPFEDPGSIKSDVSLMLHSKEALKIFMGRKENKEEGVHHIPGVSVYAKILRTIWGSCLSGNPFAKFWIQKLEEKLEESESDLQDYFDRLEEQYKSVSSRLNIRKSISVKPVEVKLNFATPYTYKIVYCLVLFDEIVTRLITMRHIALISPVEFDRGVRDCRGSINRVLNVIGGFKPAEVTLNDVRERNDVYLEAVELMGELPEIIVKNQYTPEFFPTRKLTIAGFGRRKPKENK